MDECSCYDGQSSLINSSPEHASFYKSRRLLCFTHTTHEQRTNELHAFLSSFSPTGALRAHNLHQWLTQAVKLYRPRRLLWLTSPHNPRATFKPQSPRLLLNIFSHTSLDRSRYKTHGKSRACEKLGSGRLLLLFNHTSPSAQAIWPGASPERPKHNFRTHPSPS